MRIQFVPRRLFMYESNPPLNIGPLHPPLGFPRRVSSSLDVLSVVDGWRAVGNKSFWYETDRLQAVKNVKERRTVNGGVITGSTEEIGQTGLGLGGYG